MKNTENQNNNTENLNNNTENHNPINHVYFFPHLPQGKPGNKLTSLEEAAIKFLEETDITQFEIFELIAMFYEQNINPEAITNLKAAENERDFYKKELFEIVAPGTEAEYLNKLEELKLNK